MKHGDFDDFTINDAFVTRRNRFSIVWLLPAIALVIGGWLIYKNFIEKDIIVKIHFESGAGLVKGKTQVKHKGVHLGSLKSFHLDDDLKGVVATVAINRNAEPALRDTTKFWLVEPRISMQGISGLETLVSGSYIEVRPGTGKPRYVFQALSSPPPLPDTEPGLHLTLKTSNLGSIRHGSPVHYRKVVVGDVQSYDFNTDNNGVDVKIFIKKEFASLVNKSSRFWNSSGITITGDLVGLTIRTESLASVISGGLSFYNPEDDENTAPCKNGDTFKLYDDYKSANAGIPVNISFNSAIGLVPGKTKVLYKGVEAAVLRKIDINKHLDGVIAEFLFVPRSEPALNKTTRFWTVKPRFSFTEISGLDTLFSGSYIEMDFRLDESPKRNFEIQKEPPPLNGITSGRTLILKSKNLGSISRGTGIYYRKMNVGSILGFKLSRDSSHILITAHIKKDFQHLINTNTRFWNTSGISLKADLTGINIRTESLESIIYGGVSFFNPDETGAPVKNNHRFDLHESYDSACESGFPITLRFRNGHGLKENTPIKYRGVKIGSVTSVMPDSTLESIIIKAELYNCATMLAREDSVFWIVRPKISLTRTEHLGTLISGNYITAIPGTGKPANDLTGAEKPPVTLKRPEGLDLILASSQRGALKEGVRVFYRDVPVGEVTGYRLSDTSDKVFIYINIETPYVPLVHEHTRFWDISGIGLDFNLFSKTSVKVKSVETLVTGGIALATPNNCCMGEPASPDSIFPLYDKPEKEWLKWTPLIDLKR